MNRTDLIRRAVVAFFEYGRGAVVILLDDPEPINVRADEAVAQLSEWKAEPEIIDAVARATTDYDPEHEAVVVREDAIGLLATLSAPDPTQRHSKFPSRRPPAPPACRWPVWRRT